MSPRLPRSRSKTAATRRSSLWRFSAARPTNPARCRGPCARSAGLADWVRVRARLAALPAIRKIALVALTLQEATIEIEYLGSVDQLKTNLAETNLDLVR